jgi:prevent-host-death family protein
MDFTSEDARRYWRRILNEVERGGHVEITRYGKPLAVVVPIEWRDKARAALDKASKED